MRLSNEQSLDSIVESTPVDIPKTPKKSRRGFLTYAIAGLAGVLATVGVARAEDPVNPLDFGFGTEYLGTNVAHNTHVWKTTVTNLTPEVSTDYGIKHITLDGKLGFDGVSFNQSKLDWNLLTEPGNPNDSFEVGTENANHFLYPLDFGNQYAILEMTYETPFDQDTLGLVDMTVQSDRAGALTKQGYGPVKLKPFYLSIDGNNVTMSNLTHGVNYALQETDSLTNDWSTIQTFIADSAVTNFPYSATNSKSFFRGKVEPLGP